MTMTAGLHVRNVGSLAAIASAEWGRLLPGAAEHWRNFALASRSTGIFHLDHRRLLVAAAPLFRSDYRLDTSLEGPLKVPVRWLYSKMPQLVSVPMLGMGSPLTEGCPLGFTSDLTASERTQALEALLAGKEAHATDACSRQVRLRRLRRRARRLLSRSARQAQGRRRRHAVPHRRRAR